MTRPERLGVAVVGLLGLASLPAHAAAPQLPPSHGHATIVAQVSESFGFPYADAILSGTIELGGRGYVGTVRFSLDAPEPVTSSDGRLEITCSSIDTHMFAGGSSTVEQMPMTAQLDCAGRVDGGPTGRTELLLVLPKAKQIGYGYTWQYDGSFGGAGSTVPHAG